MSVGAIWNMSEPWSFMGVNLILVQLICCDSLVQVWSATIILPWFILYGPLDLVPAFTVAHLAVLLNV